MSTQAEAGPRTSSGLLGMLVDPGTGEPLRLSDGPEPALVGASGAIFGLLGAFVVIGRHLGANLTFLYILLGINLVYGFIRGDAISWQAHVGGLVGGVIVGFILLRTRQRSQRGLQIGLLVGFSVLLVAIGIVVVQWKIGAF